MKDPDWEASGRGIRRRYELHGWVVAHCGHPTALWPWAVYDPAGRLHLSGNACHLGVAFRRLDEALRHVEAHLEDPE